MIWKNLFQPLKTSLEGWRKKKTSRIVTPLIKGSILPFFFFSYSYAQVQKQDFGLLIAKLMSRGPLQRPPSSSASFRRTVEPPHCWVTCLRSNPRPESRLGGGSLCPLPCCLLCSRAPELVWRGRWWNDTNGASLLLSAESYSASHHFWKTENLPSLCCH